MKLKGYRYQKLKIPGVKHYQIKVIWLSNSIACRDISSKCRRMAIKINCESNPEVMSRCQRSCGLCPTVEGKHLFHFYSAFKIL